MLIGARDADALGNAKLNAGESYVIFGRDFTAAITHAGTAAGETLTGTAAANVMIGGRGNDTLVGSGGADVLTGGQGNDVLAISDLKFRRIVGGIGIDTLRLDGSGLSLDLTTLLDNRLLGIEQIDITGSGNNTLTLSYREVLNISDESNTLVVLRNADDVVNIGIGWTQIANETISGSTFLVYSQGQARLKVQAITQASIAARQVFYNNTAFFGTGGINATDPLVNPINAIDPTKSALLPGGTASIANYTNYSRGLNGLVIDITNPANLAAIDSTSFQFATWSTFPDATPNFLAITPTVTVSTFATGGQGGSARVKLTFADRAIENAWLRVTILANPLTTGLVANDVFYFGNARFDVSPAAPGITSQVGINVLDTNQVRAQNGQNPGLVSNVFDVDRSGAVNVLDSNATRAGNGVNSLRFFIAPASLQLARSASFAAPAVLSQKVIKRSLTDATDAFFSQI